ncbi:DUF58 domain-containing protein [Okibacterium endophyticum]
MAGTRAPRGDTGRTTRSDATAGQTQLDNARTRLVGTREGVLADSVVFVARVARQVAAVARVWWAVLTDVITPLGWGIALGVVAAFVVGYGFAWSELVAIAWAGLIVVAAAVLFLIGRTVHEANLGMPVNRVTVGETAVGQITVRNPTKRLLGGARVEVPVGEGRADFQVPVLSAGSEYEDVFSVPALHRGVITVGPARTVRADPIGLVRREREWETSVDLFVHPQTISIPSMSSGFVRDLEGNPTRDLTSSDISFHALREYVPGDERRNIHWKSTAKTGQHMVRQFEQTRRSHLMVALSLFEGDYLNDDEFEMAVSAAGSLGVRAIRDARTVTVAVSESTPEFARKRVLAMRSLAAVSPTRLLDDLSRVDTSSRALGIADLARVAADSVAGISLAFLVCGSTPTGSMLRQASQHFPAGVEAVAIVCDPEITPSVKRAGALTVITIGFLDDLRNSLMRAAA